MAHQKLRCNLQGVIFPFASVLEAATIIVAQYDENYDWVTAGELGTVRNKGIPEAYYMHNCMPSAQGYQAVGYDTLISGLANTDDFDDAFPVIVPSTARFLFVPARGKFYIYDAAVGKWVSTSAVPQTQIAADAMVTVAVSQGQTYICVQGYGVFNYDPINKVLTPVNFTGLTMTDIKGICAANGYLIVWDDTTLAWNSLTTPTDFTPSVITGAGGGGVGDVKGKIIFCVAISGGFILYAERNAVAARFTGNVNYPYIFQEVPSSGGISSTDQVSWADNAAEHYVLSTDGLQIVTLSGGAKNAFPEVTDFLSAKIFEDFDETKLTFSYQELTSELYTKLSFISNRYLVLSYGINPPDYTHAIILDTSLRRYGKLKILHRCCFEWNAPNMSGPLTYGQLGAAGITYGQLSQATYGELNTIVEFEEQPRKTIAFLQKDGTVQVVNFDLAELNAAGTQADGVLLIGKFQFQRNKRTIHLGTEIDNVKNGQNFTYYIVPTLDGKTLETPVKGFRNTRPPFTNSPYKQQWLKHVEGQNVSGLFIGAFHLTTCIFDLMLGGEV